MIHSLRFSTITDRQLGLSPLRMALPAGTSISMEAVERAAKATWETWQLVSGIYNQELVWNLIIFHSFSHKVFINEVVSGRLD